MVSAINSAFLSTVFGSSATSSTSSTYGIDSSLLAAWAAAKAGIGVEVASSGADPNAPLATMWTPGYTPGDEALVQRGLTGKSFFDTEAKLYADLGATGDYKRLFALHTGLATLGALAGKAGEEKLPSLQKTQVEAAFARGLTELQRFFEQQQFEDIRLAQGDRVDAAQTSVAIPVVSEDYQTGTIHKGSLADRVTGLDPNANFDIVATSFGGTERRVNIDLSQMGSIPRSLGNVVSFINNKLSAAGASSRLEAVNVTPKTQDIVIGGRTVSQPYTGQRLYALKVDVRANEKVAFEPLDAGPAFYVAGDTLSGGRLIKLEDTAGAAGLPALLDRPAATADPIGAFLSGGWLGPGAPYQSAPADAYEKRTSALTALGEDGTNFEPLLRAAGEAVLKLNLADGRTLQVSTGWRSDDLEAWRARAGESEDRALLDDLAERLTQLLHEQGVAAGVDVWEDGDNAGLSIFTGDGVAAGSLSISGKSVSLTEGVEPAGGMVGGLRAGIYARSFEAAGIAAASDLYIGKQTFSFTGAAATQAITIDGGEDGIDAATLASKLNEQLRAKGVNAAASLVDVAGQMTLRIDALHDIQAVTASINETSHDGVLQAPGAGLLGGLPLTNPGEPFGDSIRTYDLAGSPLSTHAGALDISIVVATGAGDKTINVAVTAQERLDNPDTGPGEWDQIFQDRLNAALHDAGVYVGAVGSDLSQWKVAEGAGQRIASITINGAAQTVTAQAPSLGLGGAFTAERSFTSAQAASGVSDPVAALGGDPNVSVTFTTAWGTRTISASLQPGDPETLESAALRLNEALAAAGYDVGVVATELSGGGAGLRVVTGESRTVRAISDVSIGGVQTALTLDPIDAASRADDPPGALSVAERAARGAAVTETVPAVSAYSLPTVGTSNWFAGRAFDVAVGGDLKTASTRATATGADGSVYVLADLKGDSATSAIKGASDVALLKYDSAGKLVFSNILGASDAASGYALAVSADGAKVAVAGSVTGALSGAGTDKGGADSFVALYDSSGEEQWVTRRGATGNDEVSAIAFAPDGSIIVAGKTESAMGANLALGKTDGYVRGLNANGLELFTKQFGTGGDDAASALLVRDNGAGGVDIFTGGVESNRGVVRSFSYSSAAGFSAGATRDIGYFYEGAITSLAADGGALYVGGATGADRLSVGNTARGAVAGKEGFVARLDDDLVSTGLDRATYLGSAQDDSVTSLAIVNGVVYAAGAVNGVFAGQGAKDLQSGFVARLDASGDVDWARTFQSAGGPIKPASIAVDANGASGLDALGLPTGVVAARNPASLVEATGLRVGDQFQIGVDGRRLSTITLTADDTLQTLAVRINRAIGLSGKAQVVREDGVERLKITARDGAAIRLDSGKAGKDALAGLGLGPGIVSVNSATRGSMKTFGLGLLAADMKIDSKEAIARTRAELSAAGSILRQAYEAIANPNAKKLTPEEQALEDRKNNGAVPDYYSKQLANYQAALSKFSGLTGS